MAIYVGILTMHAGEDKEIVSTPAEDPDDAPDISGWTLEGTFTWTDGSGSFTKYFSDFAITTPDWRVMLENADTVGKAGKRLKFQVRRIDEGFETELDWGFINVLA